MIFLPPQLGYIKERKKKEKEKKLDSHLVDKALPRNLEGYIPPSPHSV